MNRRAPAYRGGPVLPLRVPGRPGLLPPPPPAPPSRPPSRPPDEGGGVGVAGCVGVGTSDGDGVGDCEGFFVGFGDGGAVVGGGGGGGGAWPAAVVPPKTGAGKGSTGWPAKAAVMKACQVRPAVEAPVASVAVSKIPFNDCLWLARDTATQEASCGE